MDKIVILTGFGEYKKTAEKYCRSNIGECMIIAADSGVLKAKTYGITPNMQIGDFDSAAPLADVPAVKLSEKKDDTDTLAAVKYALAHRYNEIIILGGVGGRLDHTLANIQTLLFAARQGADIALEDDEKILYLINNGAKKIKWQKNCRAAVLSLTDKSEGVTTRGVEYELTDVVLTNAYPLGVSNITTEAEIFVEVKKGALLVILER